MRRHTVSYTVSDKPSRMNVDKNRNAVSKTVKDKTEEEFSMMEEL